MAGGGKLMRLKSVLKKLNSFNRRGGGGGNSTANDEDDGASSPISGDAQAVYVGKSRRRYLLGSDVVDHPLFRELAERSSAAEDDDSDTISVSCEVVLFEHLLWMLENADPQPESLEELVEFYAC